MEATGTALVTGASRGIGRAVAVELACRGFDVVAGMRDPAVGADLSTEVEREHAAAGDAVARGAVTAARLDVDDPTTIVIPDDLRVLVNNAGIEREYQPVEVYPMSSWRALFETNVFGLIEVTRRAIPVLRANGGGVICNVTTSSLFAPMPFYAAYRASKAAVSAFGETLRAELAPFGIRIVEVMPGPIATDMLANSERPPDGAGIAEYEAMAARVYEGRKAINDQITSAADAARAIADAVLDDGAPLRVGCDPLGAGLLEAWRSSRDEDLMRAMLDAWNG